MSSHTQRRATMASSGPMRTPKRREERAQTVAFSHRAFENLGDLSDDDKKWMAELQMPMDADFSTYVNVFGWPTTEVTSDEIWLAMCIIAETRKGCLRRERATQLQAPPVEVYVTNYTCEDRILDDNSEKENIAPVAGPSKWHGSDTVMSTSSVLPMLLNVQGTHYPPLGPHNRHERSYGHHVAASGSSGASSSSSSAPDSSTATHPQSKVVAPTGSFLCRWGGSIGCQYMIHRTTSNGALIRHLELEHGFNGKILAADGVSFDGRSRTGAECLCKWEGCPPRTKPLKGSGSLLRHIKTGSHVRRAN